MELAKQIDGAPKNGDFIILQDACSRELGRWAQEANGWVQTDGTPVRISPTHWTPLCDDVDGLTDRERLLFLDPKIQALKIRQPTWNKNSLENELEHLSPSAVSPPLGSAKMLG